MLDMDDGARLWLYKTCHRQFWRVSGWYEFDDLVQDGFMKFYQIRIRYGEVKDPPHLMALFKVAFINHIHTLAAKRSYGAEACYMEDAPDAVASWEVASVEESWAPLLTAIADAPAPVLQLLEKLASSPKLPSLGSVYRRRRDGTRETLNERLCRLIKLDPKVFDLTSMLRQVLAR